MSKLSILRRSGTLLLGVGLLVCAMTSILSHASEEETLPAGNAKATAENACLSCHEARIIVQQRLSKGAWTKEVDKMTKWGAEVDPKDRDALIDYLSTNFSTDQPSYVASRSEQGLKSKTPKR